MQSSFFVVSNRGHAGSQWLSHALNLHPNIVALHGGGIATYYSGSGVCVSPSQFLPSLVQYRNLSQELKYFGVIHLYHGTSAKEPTLKLGGQFSAVIRNPIKRINSIFWNQITSEMFNEGYRYSKNGVETDGIKNPYKQLSKSNSTEGLAYSAEYLNSLILKQPWEVIRDTAGAEYERYSPGWWRTLPVRTYNRIKSDGIKKRQCQIDKTNPDLFIWDRFVYSCVNTFHFDLECFEALSGQETLIQFEKMVKDKEYYRNFVWPCIAPDYECTSEYLDAVFSIGKKNSKVASFKQPDEIYDEWPIRVKDLYNQIIEHYGRNRLETMYGSFNYTLF